MIVRLPLFCVTRQYGSLSKNKTRKCVKCDVYNILENLTYESISNFDKGAKKNSFQMWLLARQSRLNRFLLSDASWYSRKLSG